MNPIIGNGHLYNHSNGDGNDQHKAKTDKPLKPVEDNEDEFDISSEVEAFQQADVREMHAEKKIELAQEVLEPDYEAQIRESKTNSICRQNLNDPDALSLLNSSVEHPKKENNVARNYQQVKLEELEFDTANLTLESAQAKVSKIKEEIAEINTELKKQTQFLKENTKVFNESKEGVDPDAVIAEALKFLREKEHFVFDGKSLVIFNFDKREHHEQFHRGEFGGIVDGQVVLDKSLLDKIPPSMQYTDRDGKTQTINRQHVKQMNPKHTQKAVAALNIVQTSQNIQALQIRNQKLTIQLTALIQWVQNEQNLQQKPSVDSKTSAKTSPTTQSSSKSTSPEKKALYKKESQETKALEEYQQTFSKRKDRAAMQRENIRAQAEKKEEIREEKKEAELKFQKQMTEIKEDAKDYAAKRKNANEEAIRKQLDGDRK